MGRGYSLQPGAVGGEVQLVEDVEARSLCETLRERKQSLDGWDVACLEQAHHIFPSLCSKVIVAQVRVGKCSADTTPHNA